MESRRRLSRSMSMSAISSSEPWVRPSSSPTQSITLAKGGPDAGAAAVATQAVFSQARAVRATCRDSNRPSRDSTVGLRSTSAPANTAARTSSGERMSSPGRTATWPIGVTQIAKDAGCPRGAVAPSSRPATRSGESFGAASSHSPESATTNPDVVKQPASALRTREEPAMNSRCSRASGPSTAARAAESGAGAPEASGSSSSGTATGSSSSRA